MKKIIFITALISMAALFISCNGKEEKEKGKLVIYSTHSESMLESVVTEFEAETGINVEYINLMGDLADRVLAERESPKADVMFGGASSLFIDLAGKGIFERSAPSWGEELDPLFKDEEGYWYGTIQTPVVMFYNEEMLEEDEAPKDWYDLINSEFHNQLVFRDARSSSAKATYSALLYQFYKDDELEKGWEFMEALDNNTKEYFGSGSLQFQAVGRREASVSFAVLSSVIGNRDNGAPLKVVDAVSGSPVITDAIGIIKGAKNKESAERFLEFAGSERIQAKLAREYNRMPTLKNAIKDSPEWMQESQLKVMDVDWAVLSEKQSEWMQKWDTEIRK